MASVNHSAARNKKTTTALEIGEEKKKLGFRVETKYMNLQQITCASGMCLWYVWGGGYMIHIKSYDIVIRNYI